MLNKLVGVCFFIILGIVFQFTIIEKTNLEKIYPYKMKLYFSQADGIREGTEISLVGTPFGIVKEVHKIPVSEVPDKKLLETGKEFAVELTLMVQEPITLWENYEIKFKSKTAFSGRSIDIDPGNQAVGEIGSLQPVYDDSRQAKGIVSGRYYDDFFAAANNTLKENQENIRTTILNLREISTKLNNTKGTLPALLNTDKSYDLLFDTTTDGSIVLKEFRRYQEGIRETDLILIPFSLILYRQLVGSIYGNEY